MYTITLSNGTKLENLELNGNNFISENIIEDSIFDNGLDTVIFSSDEGSETFNNMVLISNYVDEGRSWFILSEKTQQQKTMEYFEKLHNTNLNSITDVQIALTEIYEMILGGK